MKVSPYNLDAIKKYGYEGVLRIENERRGIVETTPAVVEEEITADILPAEVGEGYSTDPETLESFERILAVPTTEILPEREGEALLLKAVTVNSESFEHIVADHGGSVDAPEDALQNSVIPELSELPFIITIPESKSESEDLDSMTIQELKDLAKSLGIQKYWLKREDTLREEITEARNSR